MKVLSVSAELAPWCKTGGLGDVCAALPEALAEHEMECQVIRLVPLYREAKQNIEKAGTTLSRLDLTRTIKLSGRAWSLGFWELQSDSDVRTIFLEAQGLYETAGLYDIATIDGIEFDNDVRFGVLSYAALEVAEALFEAPVDVFHVHDWHAGLLPLLLKKEYRTRHPRACTVLTIHNLAYQGWYPPDRLPEYPLEEDQARHFLALGIEHADRVTTVSPQYAQEIQTQEFGCGLEQQLQSRGVLGILNGVDQDAWNPQTDSHLSVCFSSETLHKKKEAKQALMKEMDLVPDDAPLMGIVSRFDPQKGLDLVTELLPRCAEQGIRLCVLGSGTDELETAFRQLKSEHPDHLGLKIGFDNGLAHRIFAGADMILIPSRFEPCGLTQLYAMRYGSVPIASAVGGLKDTIEEVELSEGKYDSGSGYLFEPLTADMFWGAIERAAKLYRTAPPQWQELAKSIMAKDFAWRVSARAYIDCYAQTMNQG